jgi:hypothetical protein
MTTFALPNLLKTRSKSLSVVTGTNPPAPGVLQNPEIAATYKPISKRALGFREKIAQEVNQLRRKAFVEEKLHLAETLRPAASSAA